MKRGVKDLEHVLGAYISSEYHKPWNECDIWGVQYTLNLPY